MYAQGARGVYLYNTSYLPGETKRDICANGLGPERVRAAARRYPRTYHDCVPKGLPAGRRIPSPLDGLRRFPVVAGHGAADGDAAFVVVGLSATNAPAPTVMLNGTAPSGEPSAIPNKAKYGPDRWTATAWRYPFPASAVRAGTNDVAVCKTHDTIPKTMISWVEIDLLGCSSL